MVKTLSIVDTSFIPYCKSASLREENANVSPRGIVWQPNVVSSSLFFPDGSIKDVGAYAVMKKIAWLIEPPHLRPENYEAAIKYQDRYDYIFTYDRKTLAQLDPKKRRFYVVGGSSIAFGKWGMYEKTKNVCMFFSGKDSTNGHRIRKAFVKRFGDRVDVFGAGVGHPVDSKFEILKDYRYCIVVESGQCDYYFTEKLIDPISVGTIPVYWGCPNVGKWFNEYGITPLEWVLEDGGFDYWLTEERWKSLSDVRQSNFMQADQYAICEDWMYNTYPEVFND